MARNSAPQRLRNQRTARDTHYHRNRAAGSSRRSPEPRQNEDSRSNHRARSPIRRGSSRYRRRSQDSPSRVRRINSLELNKNRFKSQPREATSKSNHSRRVEFRPAAEVIPADSRPRRRRPSVFERLGPNPEQNPTIKVVPKRHIHVLKFADFPQDIALIEFLTVLSRTMRSVIGCSRDFNYVDKVLGKNIFIYVVDQDEVDAAVGRGFSINYLNDILTIRPTLLSTTITSVKVGDIQNKSIDVVPTIMVRNLDPITIRHAIAAVIDVANIIINIHPNAIITHIRLPSLDFKLNKTSSIAFVGFGNNSIEHLDGYEYSRVAKKIPMAKSIQAPALIPTGMAQQPRDKGWAERAARANLLVIKPNPFDR